MQSVIIFALLPIPVLMLIFGSVYATSSAGKINGTVGYRTKMSMKNEDTWQYAHHYWGKLWQNWGGALLVLTIVTVLIFHYQWPNQLELMMMPLLMVQLVILCLSILPIEKELHRVFDENGNRRNPT